MTQEIRNQIDGLIIDCEQAVQHVHRSHGIAFCSTMAGMVQKLDLLKQQLEAEQTERPEDGPAITEEELP